MTRDQLKNVIHDSSLSRLDVLLVLLSVDSASAKEVKEIRDLGIYGGLRKIKNWNISDTLARSKGLAIHTVHGWELSDVGLTRAQELGADCGPVSTVQHQLRSQLQTLSSDNVREFLEEAVKCLEAKYLRAAVVLSWVGAVACLHEYVITNKLNEFNAEATKRNPKWKNAKNVDDLGRMKEYDLLQVLEAISVIGKSTKHELEQALKLRNSCGHPSSLIIGENRVAAHIEVLLLNVFTQY